MTGHNTKESVPILPGANENHNPKQHLTEKILLNHEILEGEGTSPIKQTFAKPVFKIKPMRI